jgi:hypothetical protein
MLKRVIFSSLLFCLIGMQAHGQTLKKKYLGAFSGTLPGYAILAGEEILEVEQAMISITLLPENKVEEQIGSAKTDGVYRITSETKSTFILHVDYPNQLVYEELILDKKAKTVQRKGFYPQPECVLNKSN